MLGFRSLFRTHDQPDLLLTATEQLNTWIDSKGYDSSAVGQERAAEIGNDVWGSIQHHTDDVGSRTFRARIVENHLTGSWTSELTVHASPTGNRGWVWLDILKPDDHGWTATPRLARSLVSALPVRDGAHILNQQPIRVEVGDVERVVQALTDPSRRGLAFVAGSEHLTRYWPWRDRIGDLLHDTVGLANAWVLPAEATERFNFLMGRAHATQPGSVRTYLPGVVVGDHLDGERHRFLTSTTIDRKPSRAIRRVLGHRAREQMIAARLPDFLRDLDRILRREVDDALFRDLAPVLAPAPAVETTSATPAESIAIADADEMTPEGTVLTQPTDNAPEELVVGPVVGPPRVDIAGGVADLLRDLFGVEETTEAALRKLNDLARSAQRMDASRSQLRARLDELHRRIEEVEFERDLAREEAGLEVQERAAVEEERADAERRLRHLQIELATLGHGDTAWTDPDIDIRDIRPDSFVDLLERMSDLTFIAFTGDKDVTEGLDRHGPSIAWAGKSWDALLALEDYARMSVTQSLARDVSGYLMEPPPGCRGFPAQRHAARESDTIEQNPAFRRPRELPVPPAVNPNRRIFMAAHFKIAQSARISPRIHYYDATSTTGRIYVGHIGPHLPTADS